MDGVCAIRVWNAACRAAEVGVDSDGDPVLPYTVFGSIVGAAVGDDITHLWPSSIRDRDQNLKRELAVRFLREVADAMESLTVGGQSDGKQG